jgi:hypothetical protein
VKLTLKPLFRPLPEYLRPVIEYTFLPLLLVTICAFLLVALFTAFSYNQQDRDEAYYIQIKTQSEIVELRDKSEILDLAYEFGYDPMIVAVTRQLARQQFAKRASKDLVTWRFVRTERDLTYLILSLIQAESSGDPRALNPGGPAYGLTQLLLSTARMYDRNVQTTELLTIPKNLTIAVEHFVELLTKYRGNYTLAVIAWNRGGGSVDRSIALGDYNAYSYQVFNGALRKNASTVTRQYTQ